MSETIVQQITNLYNERTKSQRMITPYSVFLTVNGNEIYSKLKSVSGVRPRVPELRVAYRKAWDNLPLNEKQHYEDTATSMGYIKPTLNIQLRRSFLDRRLRRMGEK